MKTIALFGGSFDPPHLGHFTIVEELLKLKFLDGVVVMPTFLNPFKNDSFAPAHLRLSWLKEIFFEFNDVIVSDYEVSQDIKVPTIQTVEYLLESYAKIYLVIGADNLAHLSTWHDFKKLQTKVTFIVATRNDTEIPESYIRLKIDVNTSSTSLRKSLLKENLSNINADKIIQFYKEKYEH